jgi:hypothetical protein
LGPDGKALDRKHWRLISSDLRDKFSVRVAPSSLKSHGKVIKERSNKDFGQFDEAAARKLITQAYPDLMKMVRFGGGLVLFWSDRFDVFFSGN